VPESSKESYRELKQEGVIEERQHLALETIQKFYDRYGYWPTQREAHVFLVEELDILDKPQRTEAITDGYRFLGRRMGELVQDSEDDYPDLLEKQEKRDHEYLEENFPGADSGRKGEPHRVVADVDVGKQGGGGEVDPEQGSEDSGEEVEIHYEVDGGSEVRTGSPEEAIRETSDLDSVKQLLKDKGILEEYRNLLSQQGDFVFDPGEEDDEDLSSNQGGNDAKESVSPSDEAKDEESDSEEKQQKLLYDEGEVVG
jgi:hypothetical protein